MQAQTQGSLPPWLAQTCTDILHLSQATISELTSLTNRLIQTPASLTNDSVRRSIVELYIATSIAESKLWLEEEEGRGDDGLDAYAFAEREMIALIDPSYADLRLQKIASTLARFHDRRDVFSRISMTPELWEQVGFEIIQANEILNTILVCVRSLSGLFCRLDIDEQNLTLPA